MNPVTIAGIVVIIGLAAAVVVLLLKRQAGSRKAAEAEEQARVILDRAREDGEKIKREAAIEAREKDLARLNEFEGQNREKQRKINETERRLLSKEENLERRFQSIERKERDLSQKERKLTQKEKDLEVEEAKIVEAVQKGLAELEKISGMTQEEAKAMLIKKIEDEAKLEAIASVRRIEDEAREKAAVSAREIITNAIQRSAAEHVTETTVSVVDLPSEDMKGRIIGRKGRNIRALEMATGVDIIVDDTPEAVILSSFDPIRRELARLSIQKLVTDGRILPARIEDIVESVKADLEQKIKQEGESAVLELKVRDIHPELIKLLGKLKYRTSYGQNVLQHTKEVAMLAGHHGREHGHFFSVLEDVLAVARPVLELAQELDQLGMDVADLELQDGRLALLLDLLLEVGLDRLDDVLDAGRVDAPVGDELLDGQAGQLAADRVEARQDDRLGRVVDDDVDPCGHLQGPDVAALAADDPPFHVLGRQVDHGHRGLGDVLGGRALDGVGDDLPGRDGGLFAGLILDPADGGDGLELGLVLDLLDQHGLGFFLGHAGDLLQLGQALLNGLDDLGFLDLEVLFLLGELALLLGQVAFLALDRLEAPLQVLLFAEKPALGLVDLALFLPVLTLELVQAGEIFLAGLDGRFPLDLLSVLPGPVEDDAGLLFGLGGLARARLPLEQEDDDGCRQPDDNDDAGNGDRIHLDNLLIYSNEETREKERRRQMPAPGPARPSSRPRGTCRSERGFIGVRVCILICEEMNLQTFDLRLHVAQGLIQLIQLLLAQEQLVRDVQGRQHGDLGRIRGLRFHSHFVHLLVHERRQVADIFLVLFSLDADLVPLSKDLDLQDSFGHNPSLSISPMMASIFPFRSSRSPSYFFISSSMRAILRVLSSKSFFSVRNSLICWRSFSFSVVSLWM